VGNPTKLRSGKNKNTRRLADDATRPTTAPGISSESGSRKKFRDSARNADAASAPIGTPDGLREFSGREDVQCRDSL
jgi:hypothetical protein